MAHDRPMTQHKRPLPPAYWMAVGVLIGGYLTSCFVLIGSVI